jgi:hypothetical protein
MRHRSPHLPHVSTANAPFPHLAACVEARVAFDSAMLAGEFQRPSCAGAEWVSRRDFSGRDEFSTGKFPELERKLPILHLKYKMLWLWLDTYY